MLRPPKNTDITSTVIKILILQFSFYIPFYLLVKINGFFQKSVSPISVIFNYAMMSPHNNKVTGIFFSALYELASAVIAAIVFTKIEGKHRRAFDYISTIFIIHIFMCWIICAFPKSIFWWFINLVSMFTSYFVANKVSLKHEMKDIVFSPTN